MVSGYRFRFFFFLFHLDLLFVYGETCGCCFSFPHAFSQLSQGHLLKRPSFFAYCFLISYWKLGSCACVGSLLGCLFYSTDLSSCFCTSIRVFWLLLPYNMSKDLELWSFLLHSYSSGYFWLFMLFCVFRWTFVSCFSSSEKKDLGILNGIVFGNVDSLMMLTLPFQGMVSHPSTNQAWPCLSSNRDQMRLGSFRVVWP